MAQSLRESLEILRQDREQLIAEGRRALMETPVNQLGGTAAARETVREYQRRVTALEHGIMGAEIIAGERVECLTCEGTGEVCLGDTGYSYHAPPEPVFHVCTVCDGWGWALKRETLEEWGEWPTEQQIVDQIIDGMEPDYDAMYEAELERRAEV